MERGVVVGGLMICGSFLLAALLNRSAMEEVPAPAAAPAVVMAPISPPASESEVAPDLAECAEPEADADPAVTKIEQPKPDHCGEPD